MTGTSMVLLLVTLVSLLATASASTCACCPVLFNCRSFFTNKSPAGDNQCTSNALNVQGSWNVIAAVKGCSPLYQDEWFEVTCDRNKQCGIGASIIPTEDRGIRFNEESVGFYWDAQKAFWGKDETPTGDWNKGFAGRLVPDSSTPRNTLAVKIDYDANTIWYRQSEKKAIDFVLPEPFHNKPLYAHVQVWNSNSMTLTTEGFLAECFATWGGLKRKIDLSI